MSRLVVAPNHREMPCSCLSQNDNSPRRAQGDVGCKSTFGQDIERSWSKTGCRLWRLEHVVVLVGMSFNRVIVCHEWVGCYCCCCCRPGERTGSTNNGMILGPRRSSNSVSLVYLVIGGQIEHFTVDWNDIRQDSSCMESPTTASRPRFDTIIQRVSVSRWQQFQYTLYALLARPFHEHPLI